MFSNKSLNFKFLSLLISISLLIILVIKFYFIPQVDTFLELSIEHDMKSNMRVFEKVIQIVAKSADGEKEVVRRALLSIHSDTEIPIQLRRSEAIQEQYGDEQKKAAKNELEEKVFRDGQPLFRIVGNRFQYIYPLKVIKVCQGCHHVKGDQEKAVPLGYVLGLAVAEVPKSVLLENKLLFFVKDLFAANITIFFATLVVIYLFIRYLLILPIRKIKGRLSNFIATEFDDEEESQAFQLKDEIQSIEQHIEELRHHVRLNDV